MHKQHQHQSGAVSIGVIMLVLFMLSTSVVALLVNSGSSINDSATSEKSSAALFLAESAVERVQSSIAYAIGQGTYTNTTCTALAPTPAVPIGMGRGSFAYESATSTPALCGDRYPPCTDCDFTAVGQVGNALRRIQARIHAKVINGAMGHNSTFSLDMHPKKDGSAVFTNVAYRAAGTLSTDANGNAQVGSCTSTASATCDIANNGWDVKGTGTNNVGNMGVFAAIPKAGDYTITDSLITDSKKVATRNFTFTGMLMAPIDALASIQFVGQYAKNSGANQTVVTSGPTGSVVANWNCSLDSGTNTDRSNAAKADTLVYGLASFPSVGSTNRASSVTVGAHPLKQVVSLVGDQGDFVYSQLWMSWNPPLYPLPTNTATSAASGTGAILTFLSAITDPVSVGTTLAVTSSGSANFDYADFVAEINGNTMTVKSMVSGTIKRGDALFGPFLNLPIRIKSLLSASGGVGTYEVECRQTPDGICMNMPASAVRAKVGVISKPASNQLEVSRHISTPTGVSVCGGACAFFDNTNASGTLITLGGITSGDDWASGVACLKGVDPDSIQVLRSSELQRTHWTEPGL
ncbi:MAG: hypothetical protein ACKOWC_01520 [Limnohabitans sp.]